MRQMRHILANEGANGTIRSAGGRQDEPAPAEGDAGAAATTAEPAEGSAPLAFDQSNTWMIQIMLLMAVMTFFFPFMRNMFSMKSPKRLATFRDDNLECEDLEDDDTDQE